MNDCMLTCQTVSASSKKKVPSFMDIYSLLSIQLHIVNLKYLFSRPNEAFLVSKIYGFSTANC